MAHAGFPQCQYPAAPFPGYRIRIHRSNSYFFAFLCGHRPKLDRRTFLVPLLVSPGRYAGAFSRRALFRREVTDACIDCGLCAKNCPTGTINKEDGYASDPAECTYCYDCAAVCPTNAVIFPGHPVLSKAESQDYDPDRRQFLITMAGTVAGVSLLGVETVMRRQPDNMIRPPGGLLTDFTSVCMRCGECVRVCPTQGLQPSLLEGGLQNMFTPRLVPRLGQCSFSCSACIEVCPTGAIPPLSLEESSARPLDWQALILPAAWCGATIPSAACVKRSARWPRKPSGWRKWKWRTPGERRSPFSVPMCCGNYASAAAHVNTTAPSAAKPPSAWKPCLRQMCS